MDDILDVPKKVDERESGMRITQVRKIILDRIKEEIILEKPKEEIFRDIVKRYGTKHEKFTGLIVAGSLYKEKKKQFRTWQYIMIALLVTCIVCSVYFRFVTYSPTVSFSRQLIGHFFNILVGVILINGVIKFKGLIFNTIILIAALRSLDLGLRWYESNQMWVAALFVMYVVTAGFAFAMRKKIFPNLGRRGPKKTAGGDYIF